MYICVYLCGGVRGSGGMFIYVHDIKVHTYTCLIRWGLLSFWRENVTRLEEFQSNIEF